MKTAQTIGKAAVLAFGLLVLTAVDGLCQNTSRNKEAVKAFERGEAFFKGNEFQKAIEEYTKAIELEPEWAEAFMGRGNARGWGLDANFELGQEDYDKAATLNPRLSDYAQAFRYLRDGDYTRAIETFNKVIQNRINLMEAYSTRGNSYNAIGEFEKAIADHTEAIRLNPDFSGNYENRASVYNRMEQFDRAIADCDRAIRLYPDSFYGYLFRGEAYFWKKNTERALADLNRAIQLNQGHYRPYYYRGSLYHYDKKDDSRALADLNQSLRLNPDYSLSLRERGYVNLDLKNYQEAIDDFTKYISLSPNPGPVVYNDRGNCYFYLKNYTEAINNFSEAINLDPNFANAYKNRGSIYYVVGDYNRALADIEMALKLDPEDEYFREFRSEIRARRAAQ